MRTVLSTTVRSAINVNGTDHPAKVEISRFASRGGRPTFTAAVICNGTASGVRDFRTLRECREYAAGLLGMDGRRAVMGA
jgi:hypothetical protein